MKSFFRIFILSVILKSTTITAQNFVWGHSIGTTGISEYVRQFCIDNNMNSYLFGGFRGTVDFDPGPGTYTLSSTSSFDDLVMIKYDPSGNLVWAKKIGNSGSEVARHIATDQFGNIMICGEYAGTVDFDPNSGVSNMTSGINYDIFFAKYDPAGNLLFSKSIGGNKTGSTSPSSFYVDNKNGFLYMTGNYGDSCDFDPSINKAILRANGNEDIFFAKYDFSFNLIWAKGIGNTNSTVGKYIVADSLQNVYICGSFSDSLDFNPSPLVNIKTPPSAAISYDTYFAKFDINGDYVFVKTLHGRDGGDIPAGIRLNRQLEIYVVGVFSDVVDFDAGPGTYTLNTNTNNNRSTYIAKYNNSGNLIWVKDTKLSGISSIEGRSFAMDHYERLFITGLLNGSGDFDPGLSTSTLISNGSDDAFMAVYSTNGNYLFASNIGGVSSDQGVAIQPSKYGNYIYITGQYHNSIDLDPSISTSVENSVGGGYDYFYSKYEFNNTQTGLIDFEISNENVVLFPNPTSGQIKISYANEIKEIRLFNLVGEELSVFNISNNQSNLTLNLNYPSGIYFLRINSGNELVTKKIVIQ